MSFNAGVVTVAAGHYGMSGYANGLGTNAKFSSSVGAVAIDDVDRVFIADGYYLRRMSTAGLATCMRFLLLLVL